jgi:hypothetical protein
MATDSRHAGLFDYLASRNRDKTRVKLEDRRREAAKDLVGRLPNGAVYREKTADGWMEIQMPDPARQAPLFVLPMDQRDRPQGCRDPSVQPLQQPRALGREGGPGVVDPDGDGRQPTADQ